MKSIRDWVCIPVLFILLLISGCDSLPDADRQKAEAVPRSVETALQTLNRQKDAYKALATSSDWEFLKPYAEGEGWAKSFDEAQVEINSANDRYVKKISPILKENKSAKVGDLRAHVKLAAGSIQKARAIGQRPSERREFLVSARKNAPSLIETAQKEVGLIASMIREVNATAEKAKVDYPNKSDDITGRFAAFSKLEEDARKALGVAEGELAKVSSGNANYASLADSATFVSTNLAATKVQKTALTSKLGELYRSYSKTLTDMRIDFFVDIGRTSWDEAYDYPTEHEHVWKRQVDEVVFDYFDSLSDGVIAANVCGFGCNFKVSIDGAKWKALKINPQEKMPRGDEGSELWVSNTYTKTYHKYSVVENGKKAETDWEKVSEDTYWAQEEHEGLTILSKPYGMYEEETLRSAAPPGMEYVAKPEMVEGKATGTNQYGEWRQDNTGNSFWHYYGQYAFISSMIGGNSNRYSYNDWNSYSSRNRSQPYYGRSTSGATSGVGGTRSTGASGSGGRAQSATVKGAGPSGRGRGASGKGGK